MSTTDPRQKSKVLYSRQLKKALEETGTSVYRLARKLNPAQPESARSNLQRYLAAKNLPGIESRAELADALGRPELRSVPVDEDDEEGRVPREMLEALHYSLGVALAARPAVKS